MHCSVFAAEWAADGRSYTGLVFGFGDCAGEQSQLAVAVNGVVSMHRRRVQYRCVATSVEGFVQQVAVQYLRHGYWFYVSGQIPNGKEPTAVDAKLIGKFGIDVSRWERTRRKRAGLANIQYIRHERFFLLMATHGEHQYFEDEAGQIRDARRSPITFGGYAISNRNGRACVRIQRDVYRRLKAELVEFACRRSVDSLKAIFLRLPFEPYAPVRTQLLQIWRAVNRARAQAGYVSLPIECVRWKRKIVRPFGDDWTSGSPFIPDPDHRGTQKLDQRP